MSVIAIVASTLIGATRVYAYAESNNQLLVAKDSATTNEINSILYKSPTITNWGLDYITQENNNGTYGTVGHWSSVYYDYNAYYSDLLGNNSVRGTFTYDMYLSGYTRQRYQVTITTQTQNVYFSKFNLNITPNDDNITVSYRMGTSMSTSNNTTTFTFDIFTFYHNYKLFYNNENWTYLKDKWNIEINCNDVNADSLITMSIVPIDNKSIFLKYSQNSFITDDALRQAIISGMDGSNDLDSIISILNNLSGTTSNIKTTTDAILTYCQNYLPNVYSELQIIANTNDSILDNVVAILNLMIRSDQEASSIADEMQEQQAADESEMESIADDMSIPTINPSNVADAGNAKIEEALVDTTLPQTIKTIFSTSELVTLLVIVFGLATLSYVLFGGQ